MRKANEIPAFIYNSHIREIEKKAEKTCLSFLEVELLRHKGLSESQIQQASRTLFKSYFPKAKFIQIDNGTFTAFAPNTTESQKKYLARKISITRMRKAAEGTEEGMKDVLLIGKNKLAFVEFKKVGSPAEVEPTEAQKKMHDFLLDCGFKAYFCNNVPYFRDVICEEFSRSG